MAHIVCLTLEAMSSEFHQLAEKVAQLAAMTQSLRRENAELRLSVSALTDENTELAQRMEQAHQRVTMLLEKLPVAPAAPAPNEEETA